MDLWKGVGAGRETSELLLFKCRLVQSILCIILNLGLFLYESNWLARLLQVFPVDLCWGKKKKNKSFFHGKF